MFILIQGNKHLSNTSYEFNIHLNNFRQNEWYTSWTYLCNKDCSSKTAGPSDNLTLILNYVFADPFLDCYLQSYSCPLRWTAVACLKIRSVSELNTIISFNLIKRYQVVYRVLIVFLPQPTCPRFYIRSR